jgi:hypothetical protein
MKKEKRAKKEKRVKKSLHHNSKNERKLKMMLDVHRDGVFCNEKTKTCPSCNIVNSQCTCVFCKGCNKWVDSYCIYQQSGCGSQKCAIVECFSFNFQNNTLCKQHFADSEISEKHFQQSIKFAPNVIKHLILLYYLEDYETESERLLRIQRLRRTQTLKRLQSQH